MTKVLILPFALLLAACGPNTAGDHDEAAGKAVAAPRRCPDPNIRDTKDPCSVAYIKRSPPRFTDGDLR